MEELLVNDPKVTIWDPLYTRDPHNNILVWKIWVQNDVLRGLQTRRMSEKRPKSTTDVIFGVTFGTIFGIISGIIFGIFFGIIISIIVI